MTADLSMDYAIGAFIPGSDALPARWNAEALALRRGLGDRARSALPYGDAPRQVFDLMLPKVRPAGLLVFIHGGYWLNFAPPNWSHLAAGALARDWAVAFPGYSLAPAVRIHTITQEVDAAIAAAAQTIAGPIVITGNSAGGHLCARMGCADRTAEWTQRLERIVPISPVADLTPLMQTAMNTDLKIDAAEAATESPARLPKRRDLDCTVWVGGQERPSFLWQARTLSENWDCPWHVEPGRHHFDVIDDLTDPESQLVKTLLA